MFVLYLIIVIITRERACPVHYFNRIISEVSNNVQFAWSRMRAAIWCQHFNITQTTVKFSIKDFLTFEFLHIKKELTVPWGLAVNLGALLISMVLRTRHKMEIACLVTSWVKCQMSETGMTVRACWQAAGLCTGYLHVRNVHLSSYRNLSLGLPYIWKPTVTGLFVDTIFTREMTSCESTRVGATTLPISAMK